jgi:hypothetical protein
VYNVQVVCKELQQMLDRWNLTNPTITNLCKAILEKINDKEAHLSSSYSACAILLDEDAGTTYNHSLITLPEEKEEFAIAANSVS